MRIVSLSFEVILECVLREGDQGLMSFLSGFVVKKIELGEVSFDRGLVFDGRHGTFL